MQTQTHRALSDRVRSAAGFGHADLERPERQVLLDRFEETLLSKRHWATLLTPLGGRRQRRLGAPLSTPYRAVAQAGLGSLLGWALLCAPAAAVTVGEVEPNNTLGTAQWVVSTDSVVQIDGARTFADPSDDFFAFEVRGGGALQITSSSPDGFADSVIGLYDFNGNLVASDDESGPGFMSAINYLVAPGAVGIYRIGFSGFNPGVLSCGGAVTACYDTNGDFVFDTFVAGAGAGGSTGWGYTISISGVALVPEPSAWLLLALGLPWLALRARSAA